MVVGVPGGIGHAIASGKMMPLLAILISLASLARLLLLLLSSSWWWS